MGEMDLIYLAVGIGLGLLGSRIIGLPKTPVVSEEKGSEQKDSVPQEAKQADIQPLKEELKQAQLAYEMAREMSQFKGGFLARTSHELRSPLSSLIGMHQLILSDLCDSPEEAREFVAQANISALKMVKLLDEVIAVAKTEHGTNRLEIRPLQLTKLFEDVQRLTYLQAANRNLQLEVIPPAPETYILTDPRRFRQVLVGLVDTAITRMEEGSIKISAASSPESQEVRIGIDIQSPNPVLSEPVDLFCKIPESESQAGETPEISPGLTLLMVHNLVEAMQGRLEVLPASSEESTSDSAGVILTRLECSIPLAPPETVAQALAAD